MPRSPEDARLYIHSVSQKHQFEYPPTLTREMLDFQGNALESEDIRFGLVNWCNQEKEPKERYNNMSKVCSAD